VITTTTPDESDLILSRGSEARIIEDSIAFIVFLEREKTTHFYLVTWDIDNVVIAGTWDQE
jgi:hypothetical protein